MKRPLPLILESAMQQMLNEAARCTVETGGAMCGTSDSSVVVYAGGPGPNAKHSFTSFTNDPVEDARTLTTARQVYGDTVDVIGWWHLHPFSMPNMSGTDRAAAAQTYAAKGVNWPLLIGIVCPTGISQKLTLHLYQWISNTHGEELVRQTKGE